jgi:hypothetical protein
VLRLPDSGFRDWDRLWCGTFHGFAASALRCDGREIRLRKDFEIASDEDVETILGKAVSNPPGIELPSDASYADLCPLIAYPPIWRSHRGTSTVASDFPSINVGSP